MVSISQERSRLNAVDGAPPMRRRNQWGARRSYSDARTVTEPATRVFIHISVTNPSAYNGNDAHARALEAIGISRFPSTGISYNRGIMHNGAIYEFQPVGRRGAHTVNDFRRSSCSTSGCPGRGKAITAPSWNLNYNARAYVICQNVGDSVTSDMIDSIAKQIVADYKAGFITRAAAHNFHGHRCVSSKSCPGNRMWARMDDLHTSVHNYLDNGLEGDMPITDADAKKIAEAVWRTDGLIPAPADSPHTDTNPHWYGSSHLKHITNNVIYRKKRWWRVRLRWFGNWRDHEATEEKYPDGYSAEAHLSHAHRLSREAVLLLRERAAEAKAFYVDALQKLEELKQGQALTDEQRDALAEEFANKVKDELTKIQVTVGIDAEEDSADDDEDAEGNE